MTTALYKDPTFEAAASMEVRQKRCRICTRRYELSAGGIICKVGLKFPSCKGDKKGFKLDEG